jgi:hypothetical protein
VPCWLLVPSASSLRLFPLPLQVASSLPIQFPLPASRSFRTFPLLREPAGYSFAHCIPLGWARKTESVLDRAPGPIETTSVFGAFGGALRGCDLKLGSGPSDVERMFIQSSSVASLVSEASLQAFCAAMNTPVVNIEELDVNPARAVIALSAGEYGDSWLIVALRSLASGEGAIFKYQGDPAEFGSEEVALEVGLSFAEGMGFIFETDLIGGLGSAGRKRAWKIWRSVIAPPDSLQDLDSEPPGATDALFDAPDDAKPGELLLEDLLDAEDSVAHEPEEGETLVFVGGIPGIESPSDPNGEEGLESESCRPPAQVLTKFRSRPVGAIGTTPNTDPAPRMAAQEGGGELAGPPGPGPSASDSQSARIGALAIETSSFGMEIDDGWEFLTRLVSSF